MAIALLAAANQDLDVLVVVRSVVNARYDVAGRERTIRAVWRLLGKDRGNDKGAMIRIEGGWHFFLLGCVSARRRALLSACGCPARGGSRLLRSGSCRFLGFELSTYFVSNGLFHFGSKGRSAAVATAGVFRLLTAAGVITHGLSIRCRSSIRIGLGLCRVGSLQILADHVVGHPQSCAGISRIRIEVVAIVSVPRRRAPSPRVSHWRCPRVVRPSVKCGAIIVSRGVAVVAAVAMVVVTTVAVGVTMSVIPVSAAGIIMASARITVIHISAGPGCTNRADVLALGIHMLGRDGAAAVSVAVDRRAFCRVNLGYVSVGVDASRCAALGGDRLGSCRLASATGTAFGVRCAAFATRCRGAALAACRCGVGLPACRCGIGLATGCSSRGLTACRSSGGLTACGSSGGLTTCCGGRGLAAGCCGGVTGCRGGVTGCRGGRMTD